MTVSAWETVSGEHLTQSRSMNLDKSDWTNNIVDGGNQVEIVEYSVGMPLEMEKSEQELNQRLAGTDMTWKPESGNFYHVYVPVDSDDEDVVLEQSARKVFAVFKDVANPEIDELPYPRTAHEIIKYYDKQRRRPEGCEGYLRNVGDGWTQVFFTLIANSKVLDANKATADCDRQVAEIIEGQDMTAVIDIPARIGTLKKTGIPVFFLLTI